jgi:hypothetical protein
MAIPSSYTDLTLAQYMIDTLEGVAASFDWNTSSFNEQINDVLIAYPASSVATATNIPKLRVLAAYYAWRKALIAGSTKWFDDNRTNGAGGTDSRKLDQAWQHVQVAYRQAEAAASVYLQSSGAAGHASGNVAAIGRLAYVNDPYQMDAEVSDG